MGVNLHGYCSLLCFHPKVLPQEVVHHRCLKLKLKLKLKLNANSPKFNTIRTSAADSNNQSTVRTCRNCKAQFQPSLNHPRSCRFHTAHFGGETKRKFESVHTGGTMNTPDAGKVYQYWHCCGSEDPFDPGCTAAPHSSYDDD